jgi:hypothetical protein
MPERTAISPEKDLLDKLPCQPPEYLRRTGVVTSPLLGYDDAVAGGVWRPRSILRRPPCRNERMQRKLDYTQEEVRGLKEILVALTGSGRNSCFAQYCCGSNWMSEKRCEANQAAWAVYCPNQSATPRSCPCVLMCDTPEQTMAFNCVGGKCEVVCSPPLGGAGGNAVPLSGSGGMSGSDGCATAPNTCATDDDCTTSYYRPPLSSAADCYCADCPVPVNKAMAHDCQSSPTARGSEVFSITTSVKPPESRRCLSGQHGRMREHALLARAPQQVLELGISRLGPDRTQGCFVQ